MTNRNLGVYLSEVASELARRGYATVRLRLPEGFEPADTDFAFIRVDGPPGRIEVYIDAPTRYTGMSDVWQSITTGEPEEGARRIGAGVDAAEALTLLEEVIALAEDAAVASRPGGQGETLPPAAAHDEDEEERPDIVHQLRLRNLVEEARRRPSQAGVPSPQLPAMIASLLRAEKPGVLLLGRPGVGKTHLVGELAAAIASGNVPAALRDVRVFDLNLGAILESTYTIGDFERTMAELLAEPGRPIFFLDEMHQIARQELKPLADLLKPAMARGDVRIIAATTPQELRRIDDRAFLRRFSEITIEEPSPARALKMLDAKLPGVEAHHGIAIPPETRREAVMLSHRFLPRRALPDKAIDLLDLGAALQTTEGVSERALRPEYVLQALQSQSNLPGAILAPDVMTKTVEDLAARIAEELIGQAEVAAQVERVLLSRLAERRLDWRASLARLELTGDRRPLACFLATGPTGTGKTSIAHLLADGLFEGRLIRLNASDVGPEAAHGVSVWVGSPPGFVGYNQGGVLTDGLRATPACVILVDEIEKASVQALQNVLLPLLGDGTVTDRNNGESLYATDCIVVATGNMVAERVAGLSTIENAGASSGARRVVRRHLSPEVIGRFHAILAFEGLTVRQLGTVWDRQLATLADRAGVEPPALDDAAKVWLAQKLRAMRSGARGVQDLFREWVAPTASDWRAGAVLTAQRDGLRLEQP